MPIISNSISDFARRVIRGNDREGRKYQDENIQIVFDIHFNLFEIAY